MPENTGLKNIDQKINLIRNDFPILGEVIHGHSLVYLDNAATAQKPKKVIEAVSNYYQHDNSNVHRGVHSLSQRATVQYENARKTCALFINAHDENEIVFTKGTTDSLNLLASSLAHIVSEGDNIVCTEMEHHSNFVQWQHLAKTKNAEFSVCRISEKGEVALSEFEKLINDKTKIVAITHASNTLGSINDVKKIAAIAHKTGAILVVDGAQYIPHGKVDVQDLECDFYAFSGHKLFGPTGIGVLYGKKELLNELPPYQFGGGMIREVSLEDTSYGEGPLRFEAGTPNIAGAIGLSAAMEYVNSIGYDFIHKHEEALYQYTLDRIKEIPNIKLYGSSEHRVSLLSFLIEGIHPFDLGTMLDQMGIAVRTGHHCTQPIMNYYNIPGTVRASFAFYNTFEEVDVFIEGIKKALKILS